MAEDIFNKGLAGLRLPDFARELQTGREYDRQQQQDRQRTARRQPAAGSSLNIAAEIIRAQQNQRRTGLQAALGGTDVSGLVAQQPTWEQTRLSLQGFDQLGFTEQSKLYDSYLNAAVDRLKATAPRQEDESDEAFDFRLREAVRAVNAAPTPPERTWTEATTDVLRGVGAGAAGLVGAAESFINQATGLDPTDTEGGRVAQQLRAGMSEVEQDRQRTIAAETAALEGQDLSAARRFLAEAGIQLSNLSAAGVSELVGNILPSLGIGAVAGFGARGLAAAAGLSAARQATIAGATGLATSTALEGVTTAGEAASNAYQYVMDAPLAELEQHSDWQAALAQAGGDEAQARQLLAKDAGDLAAAIGGGAGALLSAVPGSLERGLASSILRRSGAGAPVEQGLARQVAGLVGTTGLEGVTEASGDVASNLATEQPWLEGAGGSFALGALGGGLGAGVNRLIGGSGEQNVQPGRPNPAAGLQGTDVDGDPDAPADPVNLAPGTGFDTEDGAQLVWQPQGGWGYADGSPTTAQGDALIAATAPRAAAPAAPAAPPAGVDPTTGAPVAVDPIQPAAPLGPAAPVDTDAAAPNAAGVEQPATPAAASFNLAFRTATDRLGMPRSTVNSFETQLASYVEQLANIEQVDNPVHALRDATNFLYRVFQQVPALRNAVRVAVRNTANDPVVNAADGSPLAYLVKTLGIEQQINSSNDTWAQTVRAGGDPEAIVAGFAADPVIGTATRNSTIEVLNAYQAAGLQLPRIVYDPVPRDRTVRDARGYYDPSTNTVAMTQRAHAGTLPHELLHGLTYYGLRELQALANSDNPMQQQARDVMALLSELHAKLTTAGTGRSYYGNQNFDEMFAELFKPEFLALAAQTPLGTLSPEAQRAAAALGADANDSVMAALIRAVEFIIKLISPNIQLSQDSVAYTLARAAGGVGRLTAARARARGGSVIGNVPAAEQAPVLQASPAVPGASQTAGQANAATQQGATNIAGNTPPVSPRTSYTQLVTGIAAGAQAAPANPTRGFTQAAKAGNVAGMRASLTQFGEFLNAKLHDHLAPVKRWFQNLPASVSDELRDQAINALYLAPGVRDQVLQSGMDRYGGKELNQHLAKLSSKYKGFTPESIIQYVGYWITAQRVPTGNRMLIQKDTDRVTDAAAALTNAQQGNDPQLIADAQGIYDAAVRQLQERIAAVMNPATTVRKHGGGGVAGMNNAQAAQLAASIEQHFDIKDLQDAAELVYDVNAWRLATDIETGKTNPAVAAAFLRQPAVEPLLSQLAAAARIVASSPVPSPQAIATLDAARDQVIAAVRSNYVPLTGDPNSALDEDMFYNGSRQPNVAGDYELTGRTTSIPDDAITSTFASVLKSSSYAGWAPFQDAVADIYNAMPQADREAYGLYRTTVEGSGALLGQHAIVRRRGNQVYAYRFKDQDIVPAIQAANVDTNSHVLGWFGKATRMYAYAATQLNPFFAPKNAIRDFWERSELLRTRTYLDANGNAVNSTNVARRMLSYLVPSPANIRLFRATGRYAFGLKANPNSYEARYLEELLSAGGASVYGDRFARTRTDMVDAILKEKGWRKQLSMLQSMVSTYNRIFDLGPALASYIALREAGVPVQGAAGGALDLMNFRKRGEKMAHISSIYAFAQPAITGGANAISALYNPVTGRINPRGWVRLASYTVAFAAAQAFFRSLADEDEGGNRLDQQSDFVQNSHILIPVGEKGFIKVPLAFGLTRVANGAARAMIGMGTGEMTPSEAGGTWFGGSVVPVVSPIEDTDIDWGDRPVQALLTTFFPSWLKPVLSVGLNLTPWGTPVVYDNYEKTDQFRSEQFGKRIPPEYGEIARYLRSHTGVDMAPEEVRTLLRGYPLGPGTMLVNGVIENPYKRERGRPTTNPLVQQVYAGYSDTAIYFQFREAIEQTNHLKKRINAGDADLTESERRELAWREAWDAKDKELRKQKAAVTRSRELSAEGKERRKAEIDRQRSQAQTLALYQYRTATGQPAKRVEIPSELAPPAMR